MDRCKTYNLPLDQATGGTVEVFMAYYYLHFFYFYNLLSYIILDQSLILYVPYSIRDFLEM